MIEFLLFIIFFAIGSVPTGLVIGKIYGCDLRTTGSGNIGATNALRTLGKKAGLFTFIGDLLKGMLPVIVFASLATTPELNAYAPLLGLATIIGHCFSPFLKFKGGKGVATSLGVFLAIIPLQTTLGFLVFLAVVKLSGFVSLGSISSMIFTTIVVVFFTEGVSVETSTAITCATILVVTRHSKNISRLLRGEELPFKTEKA